MTRIGGVLLIAVFLWGCANENRGTQDPGTGRPRRGGREAGRDEAKEKATTEGKAASAEGTENAEGAAAASAPEALVAPTPPPAVSNEKNVVEGLKKSFSRARFRGGFAPLARIETEVGRMLPDAANRKFVSWLHDEVPKTILEDTGISNITWVDRTRSIRAAVQDSTERSVIVVPITDRGAFLAALPVEARVAGEQANQSFYKVGKAVIEVGDKDIFIAPSQTVLEELEGELRLQLMRMEVKPLFKASVDGLSLHTLVALSLDEAERTMDGNGALDSRTKELIARLMSMMKDLVAEVDLLEFEADLRGNDAIVKYSLDGKADTRLGNAISSCPNELPQTLIYMPAKSWFIQGQKIPPALFMPWLERYMEIVASALNVGPEDKLQLIKDYKDIMTLLDGDTSFAMYTDAGFPVAFSWVALSTDGRKAWEKVGGVYDYFLRKSLDTLPPETRQMLGGRNLRDLVVQLNPVLKPYGLDMTISEEQYSGETIQYLQILFDYKVMRIPPDMEWTKTVLNGKLEFAVAGTGNKLVFTFGPNGVVRAKEIMDGTKLLEPAEIFGPAISEGTFNVLMRFDYMRLLEDLREIRPVAEFLDRELGAERLAALKQAPGLFMFGGTSGRTAWVEFRLGMSQLMQALAVNLDKGEQAPAPLSASPPPAN